MQCDGPVHVLQHCYQSMAGLAPILTYVLHTSHLCNGLKTSVAMLPVPALPD